MNAMAVTVNAAPLKQRVHWTDRVANVALLGTVALLCIGLVAPLFLILSKALDGRTPRAGSAEAKVLARAASAVARAGNRALSAVGKAAGGRVARVGPPRPVRQPPARWRTRCAGPDWTPRASDGVTRWGRAASRELTHRSAN